MVSSGVCFGGKGRLHFIPDKTKVNAKLYVETLLPELVQDCRSVCQLASSFNRTARLHTLQSWLQTGLLPTAVNSLVKMNGLRTRLTSTLWTTMSAELCFNAIQVISTQPENIDELKAVLQLIWDQLPQDSISKVILSFTKRLRACVKAGGGRFEHTLKWTRPTCEILVFVITVDVSRQWKFYKIIPYRIENMAQNIYTAITLKKIKIIKKNNSELYSRISSI